jgi:hypothetical protein
VQYIRVVSQLISLDPAFTGGCWTARARRRLRTFCSGLDTRKGCGKRSPTCRWAPISSGVSLVPDVGFRLTSDADGTCELTGVGELISLIGDPDGSIARSARDCSARSEGRCRSSKVAPVPMARFEALANGTFGTNHKKQGRHGAAGRRLLRAVRANKLLAAP